MELAMEIGQHVAAKKQGRVYDETRLDASLAAWTRLLAEEALAATKAPKTDVALWYKAQTTACEGDCPHCWTIPVYLTEDGETALDRYVEPTWARYYSPIEDT
jgi:hypothetical protein